jgi:hypothetical protein
MAHSRREEQAVSLAKELGAEIVWDEVGHPWDTGRRALLSGEGTHVMVIQDDAVASEGLVESVSKAIEYSTTHPVGLYAGAGKRVRAALDLNPGAWWTGPGPTWGVGVVIPTMHVPELVRFADRMRNFSYDQRLWHYFQGKLDCWYTVPSLVDHRDEISLLSRPRAPRKAAIFGSGLEVDWSTPPVSTDKDSLYPIVEMWQGAQSKRVRKGTIAYNKLVRMGYEETPRQGSEGLQL